ncbi:MAG: hypothetical protein E7672_07035 [Ruminococcaceae bacterium]|nr:hypothetical protein [Oscillospiraceae bacterium]
MKKLTVLVLTLVCVLGLVGCNTGNPGNNEVMEDFIGKVTNIVNENESYLVDVTDSGCTKLESGDRVIVLLNHTENTQFAVGDNIKVEFNGVVEEFTAVSFADKRISVVFSVEKIENSID